MKLKKKINSIFSKNSFLNHIFKYLTRKPDVRSFTYSILSNYIIPFEEYNDIISIETKLLSNNDIPLLRNNSVNRKVDNIIINNINERKSSFSFNNKSFSINNNQKNLTYSNILRNNIKLSIEDILNDKEDEFEEIINIDIDTSNIKIDPFFEENNTTLKYLQEIHLDYENKDDSDNIVKAMKIYINNNIDKLNKSNTEIFSNKIKTFNLKKYVALNIANEKLINQKIIQNYKIITKFIDDIIESIEENIISLPYIIKSINSIFYYLLQEIHSKDKIPNLEYLSLMLLSNFLLGNIIIPLISNPYFNGIINKDVLPKITMDNLKIITKVFNKIISGKLFSNDKDPEYTIFNKYIIKTLPKIFEIINKINSQKNFKLSNSIRNLINSIGNPQRNLNYNFFEENQENIQQQNICFSWVDLIIFIDMLNACQNLDKIEIYQKNKDIFNEFVEMKSYFYDEYNGNNLDQQTDFFLIEKINYSPYFNKQIQDLLKENFFEKSNDEDEKVFMFEKFFVDILGFINKLTDKNFNSSNNSSELILNNDEDIDYLNNRELRYNEYLNIFSEEEKNE